MAKVRRHVLVCSNLDCLSWPLPRAVVALELSGPQRLLLCGEIGPVNNKQRQTNLPNSAHRCNGLVIVTIFAPITIDSPPLLGVSRTGQQSPHATDKAAGANCHHCGALARPKGRMSHGRFLLQKQTKE